MKLFKPTDTLEAKVEVAQSAPYVAIDLAMQEFFNDAYISEQFGLVLYNAKADPMANVLEEEIYITSFPEIHQLFTRPGTFEFYMNVFRKVWGDDVQVVFDVPSPGVLNINIDALGIELQDFLAREIVDNAYNYDEVIDHEYDNIAFQGSKGIKTQQQTDVLIKELHPAGIIVTATLDI